MVMARFLRYADRERIMRKALKLKNTDFTIYYIPKELIDLRKKHMPAFHEARRAGHRAAFSKSEPDKLFIDSLCTAALPLKKNRRRASVIYR